MRANPVDLLLPVLALAVALLLFGVFVWLGGTNPVEAWTLLFKGAFGDAYSWQNTLVRAAPLMLTVVPPAVGPVSGLTSVTTGTAAVALYVK